MALEIMALVGGIKWIHDQIVKADAEALVKKLEALQARYNQMDHRFSESKWLHSELAAVKELVAAKKAKDASKKIDDALKKIDDDIKRNPRLLKGGGGSPKTDKSGAASPAKGGEADVAAKMKSMSLGKK
jgi:hypothetical protein